MKNLILFLVLATSSFSFTAFDNDIHDEHFINVFETPQIVEINRTLNKKDCNNKFYIPVDLPKGSKGWIYSITTITKNEVENPQNMLYAKVLSLANKHEASKLPDFINHNNGKRDFNLYILPKKKNAESFFNCGYYEYIEKHINTKSRTAYIKHSNDDTVYIGIENNRDLKSLKLKVEVVAVM